MQANLLDVYNKRPSEELFGGQRIFLHAPQYHWHVQGAAGVDDEARQQVVALAEQLYQFGHRTEVVRWICGVGCKM